MANGSKASEASKQSAKGGGGSGMIPALLVVVLTPLLSFVMLKFMAIPMIRAELPVNGEHAAISADRLKSITYDKSGAEYSLVLDSVVSNVKGTVKTRYVRADFTIYSKNPDLQVLVSSKLGRLREHADTLLTNLSIADYEQSEVKNLVRNNLMQGFNHLLGTPVIDDISMTLVIQ